MLDTQRVKPCRVTTQQALDSRDCRLTRLESDFPDAAATCQTSKRWTRKAKSCPSCTGRQATGAFSRGKSDMTVKWYEKQRMGKKTVTIEGSTTFFSLFATYCCKDYWTHSAFSWLPLHFLSLYMPISCAKSRLETSRPVVCATYGAGRKHDKTSARCTCV